MIDIDNRKNIKLLFITIFVLQAFFSIRYGLKVPWGGDEWFSYNNFFIMGLPFSILTSLLKDYLGEVNTNNYILFRQQGLLWSLITYYFLYCVTIISIDKKISKFAIFLAIFLGLSPYFLQTSQFFRYYQLYITSSIIITFGILKYDSVFNQKRKWFYIVLLSSLFIHLFFLIQLCVYILFKELSQLNRKNLIYILSFLGIITLIVVPNLPNILAWSVNMLFPSLTLDYPSIFRGYSISSLLKPFMIIFTFMFGRNLIPLSYLLLDICYFISGLSLIYGLYILIKNRPDLRHPIIFSAILPLIFSVFIIEPISLPMMTQLAPHHVTFLFPWIAYIFYQLWSFSVIGRGLNLILFCGLIYASYLHQTIDYVDWNKIQKVVGEEEVPVISDNAKTCEFFLNNSVTWFQYTERVENIINTCDTISLTMTNWKNYQIIDSLQFWHNPKGSKQEYQSIKGIIKLLKNNKFSLINGYSFFPIHSFTFARNNEGDWAEPWFYDLKYGDLKLPLFIEDNKIIGFHKIEFGEDTQFDSSCYYFIQTLDPTIDTPVIQITNTDGSIFKYNLDDENDLYCSNFCRSINKNEIVYTYKKRPLVSNSMRYPGSILNSEGRIYKFTEQGEEFSIMPLNRNVTLFIAILDKEN